MRCVGIIGAVALLAGASMALAGVASATTITSPAGSAYTNVFHAVSTEKIILEGVVKAECDSTIEGSIQSHGAGITAAGNLTHFTFTNCTKTHGTTVLAAGTLTIHSDGNSNGTLTSSELQLTVVHTSPFGEVHCIYGTNNTDIGTLTGTTTTGGNALIHATAVIPTLAGSDFICGATAELKGTYRVTTPAALIVD